MPLVYHTISSQKLLRKRFSFHPKSQTSLSPETDFCIQLYAATDDLLEPLGALLGALLGATLGAFTLGAFTLGALVGALLGAVV